jgi:MtaA/CmuA family methyltransferase
MLSNNKIFQHPIHGKVPFSPILMHFAARFIGKTYAGFASDHKVLVDANLRCMEHFKMDTVSLISDPYRETSAFGAPIRFIQEGVPQCTTHIVQTLEDAMSLPVPDVYKCERTRDRIDGAALFYKTLQGKVPIIGWIEGPLAEACDLAGIDMMLVQMMVDPGFANVIMDKCTEMAKNFAKAQIDEGCTIIGIGDAICSQVDLDTYNLFVKPRHQEICDFIHSMGVAVKLHICGDINHLIPSFPSLKVDILDCDWQIDIHKAKDLLGDDVLFSGNLNPVLIQDDPKELIKERSLGLIHEYGNLILSGGCEITVLTPEENLLAMADACK